MGELGAAVLDPLQDSWLALVEFGGQAGGGATVELIAAASDSSPVAKSAASGGGFHHICYEVDRLDQRVEEMRGQGLLLVRGPDPAILFGGRRVAFLFSRIGGLIELLEAAA